MGKVANRMFKEMRDLDRRVAKYRRQQVISNVLTWVGLVGVIGFLVFAVLHSDKGPLWQVGDYRVDAPWNEGGGL